ncbi:MAG: 50S ribosomal protein L13 [Chloroflexi bacterium]|nr:50S ribosomal protein L13 [Chloroflexota bacterium]
MKTFSLKKSQIQRQWHVVDASEKALGRLASEVAQLLKGKHKATYTPHLDMGDYVIVINAAQVQVTGNKLEQKSYYRHTQYPGGLKNIHLSEMMQRFPGRVIEHAVAGMLPHSPMGRAMGRRLKVYPGPEHPHQAQVASGVPVGEA